MTLPRLFYPLVLLCLGGLAGCKPDAPPIAPPPKVASPPKIVVLLSANGTQPIESAERENLAKRFAGNADLILKTLDAGGDSSRQVDQLREATATHPEAILIRPVAGDVSVAAAIKSGILVIGLGEEATASGCSTVIRYDETEMGRLAGKAAVQAMTEKAAKAQLAEVSGRVVEIRGDETSPRSNQRHAGFIEAIKAAPGLIVVHDAPGDWTQKGGFQRTEDALRLQGTFDLVYAHTDLMARGVGQALGNQRKSVFIIGTDGFQTSEGGLAMIIRGEMDATVQQPPLVDFAWQIIQRKLAEPSFQPKPTYQLTPRIVLPEDIIHILRTESPPFPSL